MYLIQNENELLAKLERYPHILIIGKNSFSFPLYRYFSKLNSRLPANERPLIKFMNITACMQKFIQFIQSHNQLLICTYETSAEEEQILAEYNSNYTIAQISHSLFTTISVQEHPHLDFICTGFVKSGTTSLQIALRKHPEIFLPKGKETHYLHWKNRYLDAPVRLHNQYFSGSEIIQKKVGNIEPTYNLCARDVYECFGPDLKIIFMMRNPIEATFSYFKMMMRVLPQKQYVDYFKTYRTFSIEMFDDFLDDFIFSDKLQKFRYDLSIQEYLKYYNKEQMHFLFLEDFAIDTNTVMQDLQSFLSVTPIPYTELPKKNSGEHVCRSYYYAICAEKLSAIKKLKREGQMLKKRHILFEKFASHIQKHAYTDEIGCITSQQRNKLHEYYMPVIESVSNICNRDVKPIWN